MAEPIRDIDPDVVRRNLEAVRDRCGPGVEILAATKYVVAEEMERLAEAGIELVGENRLQDLEAKRERSEGALPGTSSATCRAAS